MDFGPPIIVKPSHELYGEVLLLHSYEEHVLRRPPSHASICAALNHAAPAWRLVAQRSSREGYATHTDHARCVREMNGTVPAGVCRLLAVAPAEPLRPAFLPSFLQPEQQRNIGVAEPLGKFWEWMKRSGLVDTTSINVE